MIRSIAILSLLAACNGDDGDDTDSGAETYTLTATIPSSYATFHTGIDFTMALVDADGAVADEGTGVIGTDTTVDLTVPGGDGYDLHFWIDANIDAGTAGTCDYAATGSPDHMWSYPVGTVDADADFAVPGHTTDFQDVCATFE